MSDGVEQLKVLAIDDELGMRMGMQRTLRHTRIPLPDVQTEVTFDCDIAESGEEALAKIDTWHPDILLLDYKMGGMSGLEVLEALRERQESVLTVMVTAYASLDTAVAAIKQGAHDFLAKPFTPAELKSVIRKTAESLILARQARKLSQEKRRVRFEFISVLSHELKAPLGAIEGYLDLMENKTAGDSIDNYATMLNRCKHRIEGMRKLIFDLLDLTRIESGEKTRQLRPVNLSELTHGVIETFAPQARQRDITVNTTCPDGLTITGDPGELEIIFNNLVSNAIKYNRDGGRIDLAIDELNETVRIVVADTGLGMTPEECRKLFNDFVRIKNAQTRDIPGSGLGLSTVRKIAYLYDGTAEVTSEPGVGSTFTVVLKKHSGSGDNPAEGTAGDSTGTTAESPAESATETKDPA